MDSLMHIDEIARTIGLPVATVQSYAERYALFLPVVRTGADVGYPPESVTLIAEIDQAVAAGATFAEIELGLQQHIPTLRLVQDPPAVEAPEETPDLNPTTFDDLARLVIDQRAMIAELMTVLQATTARVATAEQFHGLRAETASLAAVLSMRDTQLEHANAMILAELRQAVDILQDDIASLRANTRSITETESARASASAASHGSATADSESATNQQSRESDKDQQHRTPRRMGQPRRVHVLNGIGKN